MKREVEFDQLKDSLLVEKWNAIRKEERRLRGNKREGESMEGGKDIKELSEEQESTEESSAVHLWLS